MEFVNSRAVEELDGAGGGAVGRPELLAPAGDWECARAAVENGADAIYFGLERFNARMRARNFTVGDLPELMTFLHRRGARGYVTFNTLVFSNELRETEAHLRSIIAAGVDAAIVQDVGICRLIRVLSPDFPIHASTQMTITSAAGVEFARELGCQLVVLARECSVKEIGRIRAEMREASAVEGAEGGLPLEVFVHGALCVAYSGQCLTSESLGGRSANRGECAQACRMPYDLISDGRQVPLEGRRYLLSPQDLAGLEVIPELVRAGVSSFKIEGRLKSPEYVANITSVYREAIDRVMAEAGRCAGGGEDRAKAAGERVGGRGLGELVEETRHDLEMAFSRGLHTGWLRGINNQELVHARFGKKRGVRLGDVVRVEGERVVARLVSPVKAGDGVVFDAGHPEQPEEGGRLFEVGRMGDDWVLGFGRDALDFRRVKAGDRIWKTSDPALERKLRQSFAGDVPRYRRPIDVEVHGVEGGPLTVIGRDEQGHVVKVDSEVMLARAINQPLTEERLCAQLGRLGGTPFRLGGLRSRLQEGLILPVGELNRVRRELVSGLERLRSAPKRWTLNAPGEAGTFVALESGERDADAAPVPAEGTELIVLVRNLEQLEAVVEAGVRVVYCEFENPKGYRDAVRRFRSMQAGMLGGGIWVVPPRITKPGEDWILKLVRSSEPDGILVRNHDHLSAFEGCRLAGDFSLNVANELTAEHYMRRRGLERVTASYDLNVVELEALLRAAPPAWFEITIHQHMPMFHMEHCVFCAFLSRGTDYSNCGRPCEKHDVRLRDRVGAEHPLKADAGCRNTLYNALAQTGAEWVWRLMDAGARRFRIDLLNERAAVAGETVVNYRRLLGGELSGAELWKRMRWISQLGVTRGQMS